MQGAGPAQRRARWHGVIFGAMMQGASREKSALVRSHLRGDDARGESREELCREKSESREERVERRASREKSESREEPVERRASREKSALARSHLRGDDARGQSREDRVYELRSSHKRPCFVFLCFVGYCFYSEKNFLCVFCEKIIDRKGGGVYCSGVAAITPRQNRRY